MYQGRRRARTFETAFLEYGATIAALRPGGGEIWLRNDPMGGGDDCSWREYRSTWESTLTAALLWPGVHRYEVMPWPERILGGRHPTVDRSRRKPGEVVEMEPKRPYFRKQLKRLEAGDPKAPLPPDATDDDDDD